MKLKLTSSLLSGLALAQLATSHLQFFPDPVTWEEAQTYCKANGGMLAKITGQQQQQEAQRMCTSKRCWLGLNDRKTEGKMVWDDGKKPGFTRWTKKEPNDAYGVGPGQDCVYIWGKAGYGRDGQWGDGECTRTMPFICTFKNRLGAAQLKQPNKAKTTPGMVDGKCVCRKREDLEVYEKEQKCHPHLYNPQIAEYLDVWASRKATDGVGISKAYMAETAKRAHLHFIIKGGKLYSKVYMPYMVDDWSSMLLDILRRVDIPDCEFVLEVLDKPTAFLPDVYPIFHHVRTDAVSEILAIHPWHYLDLVNIDESEHENEDLSKRNTDWDTWQYPWNKKKSKLVWRGSANGGEMLEHNWKYFPRNKLAALGQMHPKQVDAGFSDMQVVNQWMQENRHLLQDQFKGYMWEPDWAKYKYIAVVDGIGMSIRYAGVMLTNSVAVKQNSPYYEYYYSWLEPFKHYVPYNYSMNDLVDKVKWLQDNPKKAKSIAYEGSTFMQEIYTTEEVICYMSKLLIDFSALLDYAPEPDHSFKEVHDADCPCRN